jgi:hypothetical protein
MFDVFDRLQCELQEQKEITDQPIDCFEPASSTVMSGDLKGTLVCVVHAARLREDDYEVIEGLEYEND